MRNFLVNTGAVAAVVTGTIVLPFLAGVAMTSTLTMCASQHSSVRGRVWDAQVARQVVLHYDHRTIIEGIDTEVVEIPKDYVVRLGLIPLDAQAAMPNGSLMLCTPYTEKVGVRLLDGTERGNHDEIAFRCGGKRYLFVKMDVSERAK